MFIWCVGYFYGKVIEYGWYDEDGDLVEFGEYLGCVYVLCLEEKCLDVLL